MSLDLAKYRTLFLEEATDHLGEISRALLDLEKAPDTGEAIDTVFRMAHSIKSMAASLGYDSISQLSHALEDRMERVRSAGRVSGECLTLLFRGLEELEAMVASVRDTGEAPPSAETALIEALSQSEEAAAAEPASVGEPEAAPAVAPEAPAEARPESPPEKKALS